MGYMSQRNEPLCEGMMQRLLKIVQEEMEEVEEEWLQREYIKFGAAAVLVVCGSLRGPEVFLLDLAGLRKYITLGRNGTLAVDPLKPGADFSNNPYVMATLIGEFKGELGTRHHLIALASRTSSGIELRWWLEQLLRAREAEGCKRGPACGHRDGTAASMSEYNDLLHFFLRKVREKCPDLILPDDNIELNYSFSRTFRCMAEGRTRAAQLNSSAQNAMNRWRKIEEAKGKHPRFNIIRMQDN